MKSSITQEMSMQNGSQKRSSPSIIARLMGLDVLPPHRELKPVENQQRRWLISSDKARGKQTFSEGSMDEERFKDVLEVLDADKGKTTTSLNQRRSVNANLNEAEMAFIRYKFMEAKRLSTDEKLRYSKEFNETLEALDTNNDLLLKFLHQPDLQSIAQKPQCSQATTLTSQWHGGGVELSKKQWKKRSGCLEATEIVVLKPNLGKPQTCANSSCDEARADLRLPSTIGSLKDNEDVFLLRNKSRDSREIARIVSRQLKASCGNESSINFDMARRFRGYESSSGSDFSGKNHILSLSSRSPESVSKEAMRRMSERWKRAHDSEKEIEIRRRNTLADMLAPSDREARLASFNRTNFKQVTSKRFERRSELPDPIGISSRDGWKGTSRSRATMHKDRTCSHTIVLPKKLTTRDGLVKESSFHNRPSSSKNLYMDGELFKENLPALKTQRSLSVHVDADTEESGSDYEDAKSNPSLEPLDFPAVTSLTDHLQESAEEGDQPSPQASFHDEFSSNSECFESLSADLQGLRMKLQLLKRESDTYNEGEMLVSSEEEEESSIVTTTDETMITHELVENWKSLYLADILANSTFSDLNPTSFMASWHSSESPLDPSLFDDLEKKYYFGLKISNRLERKLVFDWINSEILEFFEQFTDLRPTKVCPIWDISRIHETLRELVTRKYMKQSRDTKEKEMLLPSLEDGFEVIGKEIEEMLTQELIAELM